MAKADVLLGLQWGDEGKGKIVDVLAPHYHVVARFQGGPNAGHTLEFDGIKHVLHQIPSGIFRPSTRNVIGNGVVLDPIVFRKEVESLRSYSLNIHQSLYISRKATLILPTHRLLDQAYEADKGEARIGSTLRGIGPAYQDKIGRQGLRVGDIMLPDFNERFKKLTEIHFNILSRFPLNYNWQPLEDEFLEAVEYLRHFRLTETEYFINEELASGNSVLAEGAQGALLDIDFGSYPYVTSSNTVTAGACTGLGIAPRYIGNVYGIFKAYCTRVGGGPFPTELLDETGEQLRQLGNEFGSTTGRPRRCGWLDLPALKYSIMINGVSHLFMMKVDVLSRFHSLKVCTHYRLADGTVTDRMPFNLAYGQITPVYHELPGWNVPLDNLKDEDEMPGELKNYISFIEEHLRLPVVLVSTGPDRKQTLYRHNWVF
jgi:adenylosuccinate synthase